MTITRPATPEGGRGGLWPSYFYVTKRRKRNKGKKERVSKQKLLKGCHQSKKCYCFNNVYCLILERLEFKFFSWFHGPSTLKSISLVLPNLALICAALPRKLICLRCVLHGIFSYVLLVVMNWLFSSFFFYLFETCKCWYRKKKQIRYSFMNAIFQISFQSLTLLKIRH